MQQQEHALRDGLPHGQTQALREKEELACELQGALDQLQESLSLQDQELAALCQGLRDLEQDQQELQKTSHAKQCEFQKFHSQSRLFQGQLAQESACRQQLIQGALLTRLPVPGGHPLQPQRRGGRHPGPDRRPGRGERGSPRGQPPSVQGLP